MRRSLKLAVAIVFLLIVVLATTAGWAQKWLWMRQLGYGGIFWTTFSFRWEMFCIAFVAASVFVWINLRMAAGAGWSRRPMVIWGAAREYTPMNLNSAALVAAALAGLIFAFIFMARWDTYLRFRYGGSFGVTDPIFGADAGFYVFRLPFYELLHNGLTGLVLVTILAVLAAYAYFSFPGSGFAAGRESRRMAAHLSVLLFVLVANWGWGFYLDRYELLYSPLGVVYGVGYAVDHVTRPALWVMIGLSAVGCALLAINFSRPRLKALAWGSGLYIAVYIAGVRILPAVFESVVVRPNELRMELPYLKHYIDFTRGAYNLNAMQTMSYPALTDLTQQAIARNADTVSNIRLWDSRPLLQTYRQTQEIRLYYQFYTVDVDRYHLPDGYHQVMLSARELSERLPQRAETWVNEHLQFTHGYGLVMSFVSKAMSGGLPQYLLENIPPESAYGLDVKQPGIYYGEVMPGYRIVDTGVKELDYPKGSQNVYTSYHGTGGIPVDSLWKRALFAWTQSDANLLLTSYLRPGSRIQIWRRIQERVGKIAPFLRLDGDPYPVTSGGRLYWIQDAYTVSDRYPYSSPYGTVAGESLNYIRNSVKVVEDMYDGTVRFFVMDPGDPVLGAYRRAFPGVFLELSQLSADLRSHLRYPEDLFYIQANQFRSFHMTDPQVFYNQEDLWVFAHEKYSGQTVQMNPYYVLMKLPGSDRLEFLLMTPFTPQHRDNMIGWMAARCDLPEYGKMLVYELPKEKLVYGPNQIEAMIDQNTAISRQLTLWDQKGSRVIRGDLIVIPIENAFLYVEPLYLSAEGASFPQLKRVIAATAEKVVMEPTLDGALAALFGTPAPAPPAEPAQVTETQLPATGPELAQARRELAAVQNAMRQGDWEKLGKAMEALDHALGAPGK
jgi:uncharacterized membrane protein (UPF0182 family)